MSAQISDWEQEQYTETVSCIGFVDTTCPEFYPTHKIIAKNHPVLDSEAF